MAIPAKVLPDDQAIRPLDGSALDGWSLRVKLDPTKDWSASTFTVDGGAAFTVDQSHKADDAPYVWVRLAAADLRTVTGQFVHWNLSEDTLLRRAFLTQRIKVVSR